MHIFYDNQWLPNSFVIAIFSNTKKRSPGFIRPVFLWISRAKWQPLKRRQFTFMIKRQYPTSPGNIRGPLFWDPTRVWAELDMYFRVWEVTRLKNGNPIDRKFAIFRFRSLMPSTKKWYSNSNLCFGNPLRKLFTWCIHSWRFFF